MTSSSFGPSRPPASSSTSHRARGEPAAVFGLTGGIGSGKSTVARMLAEEGFPVLDADVLAREVVAPGQPAHGDIGRRWPEVIAPDGSLDRSALGRLVFADAAARRALEAITHPRIRALMWQRVDALAEQGHRIVIYEASLLVETGQLGDYDGLIVVSVPPETQVARAVGRGRQSEAEVRARLSAQLPLAEKLTHATHVIDNAGSLPDTRAQVAALAAELRAGYSGR